MDLPYVIYILTFELTGPRGHLVGGFRPQPSTVFHNLGRESFAIIDIPIFRGIEEHVCEPFREALECQPLAYARDHVGQGPDSYTSDDRYA